ncbi:hypothetical protein F544_19300 [Bibersteinia trehalosi USDA-ARS-USMARC-190]|uniref:Uncharacterized protein n=1 Tax=Bibersteinia trehalosi USDA-ARS-USMARC-190 TaxID=1263832 RepID=W0RCP4_BIBTR|nr:hypothetical protein F544_19300 [Bibersteinia trehalosi USDA-ARS-USMARC-190]
MPSNSNKAFDFYQKSGEFRDELNKFIKLIAKFSPFERVIGSIL